jgi:hypothetical protein
MRAHQPGSTPIDIPETVPNPAHTPAPAPERAPTKVPDKVPEKVIAPAAALTQALKGDRIGILRSPGKSIIDRIAGLKRQAGAPVQVSAPETA